MANFFLMYAKTISHFCHLFIVCLQTLNFFLRFLPYCLQFFAYFIKIRLCLHRVIYASSRYMLFAIDRSSIEKRLLHVCGESSKKTTDDAIHAWITLRFSVSLWVKKDGMGQECAVFWWAAANFWQKIISFRNLFRLCFPRMERLLVLNFISLEAKF